MNLAAETCFFEDRSGICLLGNADIVKDQMFEIQAIDGSRIGHATYFLSSYRAEHPGVSRIYLHEFDVYRAVYRVDIFL